MFASAWSGVGFSHWLHTLAAEVTCFTWLLTRKCSDGEPQ